MICGLEVRITDELPDRYDFALVEAPETERERIIRTAKDEVAREIFEEIELFLNKAIDGWRKERRFCYHDKDIEMIDFRNDAFKYCLYEIAELKKKYAEN